MVVMSPSLGAGALLCNVLTGYLLYGEAITISVTYSSVISIKIL